ncbi:hypothetical protein HMPREF0577_2012 [Mobiluncus mulieris ATCC 35243]|nr:hypothetical protein HMPREF0577_2012 [Mobiluncus mulieris ATCC 35243]
MFILRASGLPGIPRSVFWARPAFRIGLCSLVVNSVRGGVLY